MCTGYLMCLATCFFVTMRKLWNLLLMLLKRLNPRLAVIYGCFIYFSVTLGEDGVVVKVRWTKTRCQSPQMLARRKLQKMLSRALLPLSLIRKMNQRNTIFIQNMPFNRTAGHFTQAKKSKISHSSKLDQTLYIFHFC